MIWNKLHIAIKQAIDSLGIDGLKSPTAVNVWADFGAFSEVDGSELKSVAKDLLSDGYGVKVIQWRDKRPTGWKEKNNSYIEEFIQRGKYKNDVVWKIADAILYGVGLIDSIDASTRKGMSISSPQDLLDNLQLEYLKTLETVICKRKDCLGLDEAYYTAESLNQLYFIEGKLQILSDYVSVDSNWCQQKKNECLNRHNESITKKKSVAKEYLDTYSSHYIELLENSLVVPEGIFNLKPAYYEGKTCEEIDAIAEKLAKSQEHLGKKVTFNGPTDRKNIISKRDAKRAKTRKTFYSVFSIVAVVITIVIVERVRYAANRAQIDAMYNTLAIGDSLASCKQYEEALGAYQLAAKNYSQDYRKSRYQSVALQKSKDLSEKIYIDWKRQCDSIVRSDNCLSIIKVTECLPSNIDTEYLQRIKDSQQMYYSESEAELKNRYDNLLKHISENQGEFDSWSEAEIDTLLYYYPNHYWLNLIKAKE